MIGRRSGRFIYSWQKERSAGGSGEKGVPSKVNWMWRRHRRHFSAGKWKESGYFARRKKGRFA